MEAVELVVVEPGFPIGGKLRVSISLLRLLLLRLLLFDLPVLNVFAERLSTSRLVEIAPK